jgi:hypothetical protein
MPKKYLYRTATLKKHMQMLPGLCNENEYKIKVDFYALCIVFIQTPTEKYR